MPPVPPVAAWSIALFLAFAGWATVAYLLRQRGIVLSQSRELASEVESLNDRLWALADSEERYRSLIEAQGDLIVRRDGSRIVYANSAYAALLGLSEETVIGSVAEPKSIASRPPQILPDGSRVFDEQIETPAGHRWIAWVETVVPAPLGRTALQRVGRDISGRIASEAAVEEARARAEAANEAKSRFLATVSHEFRTPLNGILGMADLLEDTGLDPEQASYLRALRTSGDTLLSLVDELLDFARLEAGRLDLAEERFEVGFLAETVSELMAPRAEAKGLELASHLAPDLPSHFIGDRDRLRQILLNLVGNAIKFTHRGGVGLRLSRSPHGLEIAVSDTGIGIPGDRLEAIFEEFEQAETEAARRQEGAGLGLAIVRRLAMLMGGEVRVESKVGQGSTFRVVLPLKVATAAVQPPVPDWRGKRLLVVSPALFGSRFLSEIIATTGAEARTADSETEAARCLAQKPYDAVLIDLAIGREALPTLQRAAGKAEAMILLSPSDRRQFGPVEKAGFSGQLIKPVRARSLYQRLFAEAETVSAPGASDRHPQSDPSTPLNVLVAEDNEINALLARRTLERLGCTATWVRDGRAAVSAIEAALAGRRPAFDLVLLDIRMPVLDGLSAAREIRALEGRRQLPLIAVSANAATSDREAALAAGLDDCLPKPLQRPALEAWLDRLRTQRQAALRA